MNSQLLAWYKQSVAPSTGMGLTVWLKFVVDELPIPSIPPSEPFSLTQVFDEILLTKNDNADADISDLEAQINHFVYRLYGLTQKEVEVIQIQ